MRAANGFSFDDLIDDDLPDTLVWHLEPGQDRTITLGKFMCLNRAFYRAAKTQLDAQSAAIRIAARNYVHNLEKVHELAPPYTNIPVWVDTLRTRKELRQALEASFSNATTKWLMPQGDGEPTWMLCSVPLLLAIANGKCMACAGCKTRCTSASGNLAGWEVGSFGDKTKPRFYNIDCFHSKTVMLDNDGGVADWEKNGGVNAMVCKSIFKSAGARRKKVLRTMARETSMSRNSTPTVWIAPCRFAEPTACFAHYLGIDEGVFERLLDGALMHLDEVFGRLLVGASWQELKALQGKLTKGNKRCSLWVEAILRAKRNDA